MIYVFIEICVYSVRIILNNLLCVYYVIKLGIRYGFKANSEGLGKVTVPPARQ